jgi:hypothetical protein
MPELLESLFVPEIEARRPWLARLWIGGLFLGGLVAWAYVMGWGAVSLGFRDWSDINLPRLSFMQNALRAGEWPLHAADRSSLHGVTDRFLTLPDVITTPQSLLLLFMPVPAFVLLDVLLHFTIGFAGVCLLRRHFQWSLASLTGVFLLVLFNGHILAHYSAGHFTWGPYFLFPLVCLLVVRFLEGDDSWRSVAWFAALIFYMILAGGQHHAVWVFLFLLLLAPMCGRRAWWPVAVVVASGLLSAVRLLPPVLELEAFRNHVIVSDVIGYPSIAHLLESLVSLRRETPAFDPMLPANIWFFQNSFFEFNAYIGVGGLALVIAGVYHWLRQDSPRYRELLLPVAGVIALSLGSVYRVVRATHIPLFESERYTSRMFSLPMTLLIVLAAVAIDRRLRTAGGAVWHRALALAALVFVAIDMAANARLWRVAVSSGVAGGGVVPVIDVGVVLRSDPVYVATIGAGLALTLITAGGLVFLARRERPAAA